MIGPGARSLVDALRARDGDLVDALVAVVEVTAVPARQVTVRFPGAASTQTWPRMRAYSDAAVGDVAVLLGRPGSWVALGALA